MRITFAGSVMPAARIVSGNTPRDIAEETDPMWNCVESQRFARGSTVSELLAYPQRPLPQPPQPDAQQQRQGREEGEVEHAAKARAEQAEDHAGDFNRLSGRGNCGRSSGSRSRGSHAKAPRRKEDKITSAVFFVAWRLCVRLFRDCRSGSPGSGRFAAAFGAAGDARAGGVGGGAEIVAAVETEPQSHPPDLPPPAPEPAEGSNQRQGHGEPERDG